MAAADTETMEYAAMMRRMLRGWAKRLEDADEVDVAELVAFQDEVRSALDQAVAGMRRRGDSWAAVGRATGTTRQRAQKRFGASA